MRKYLSVPGINDFSWVEDQFHTCSVYWLQHWPKAPHIEQVDASNACKSGLLIRLTTPSNSCSPIWPTSHCICICIFVIAHLSLPWSIGWVALSFLVRRRRRLSRYGNTRPNLTSSCPTPQNPYIFWKLMIIAIQKWIRNTNTKTKTNTKTMTKTKTPRE